MISGIAYSAGMMTTDAATSRGGDQVGDGLDAHHFKASISSEIRMAPISAVAPAPTVAACDWPVTIGAVSRTLTIAARKPVKASTPMLPSEAKPWMAISEPADRARS